MGKKHPYYGKSMIVDFPDFPHTTGFVPFSRTVWSLWGNPYISHMLKYTIGWESDGKKAPILLEKIKCRSPRLSPYHGLCCIFPYCGKFMGKPIHFPISHMLKYTIGWESDGNKAPILWEKCDYRFPRLSPTPWVLLHFPVLWEISGETHAFPIWFIYLFILYLMLTIYNYYYKKIK